MNFVALIGLIEKIESKNSSTLFLVKVAAEEDKEG
jgi:hypothetical protein